MNVFYNRNGIGDTLIVTVKDVDRQMQAVEKKGDIAKIYHKETGEVTGINFFQISEKRSISMNGALEVNEEWLTFLNEQLSKVGFDPLNVDLSPKFVVGFVAEKLAHPNADKLSICQVNIGQDSLQIVCGAPNVAQGQKVVVAKVGAIMPSGMIIKDAELRGVASKGMICSAKELDLPDAPKEKGILVLSEEYEIGQAFLK